MTAAKLAQHERLDLESDVAANTVDDGAHVTISGRAYFALDAARTRANAIGEALVRLNDARSREGLLAALDDLCREGHALNERYMKRDGEGAV